MIPAVALVQPVAVVSVGMVCSVGLSARAACAAIRAHVAEFVEVPFFDSQGQRIVAAPVEAVVRGRQGYHRLIPLLRGALADCIGGDVAKQAGVLETVPCLIVIGHAGRPDYPVQIEALVLSGLHAAFGGRLHPETRVISSGTTGFFEAIAYSRTVLTRAPACLVVAVDSLINRKMLASLESLRRLKTDDNSDGVIPGEAAAAVWLTSPERADGSSLSQILGIGLADEPSALKVNQPNKGIGLAMAMSNALIEAAVSLTDVDFRIAGLTGERLDFVEASTALARVQKVHRENFDLWAPAEQIGDVGSALPACMAVVATLAFAKGYAPGRRAILYCSSDREIRAACIMTRPRD